MNYRKCHFFILLSMVIFLIGCNAQNSNEFDKENKTISNESIEQENLIKDSTQDINAVNDNEIETVSKKVEKQKEEKNNSFLFLIEEDGKYGYIDQNGTVMIKPQYAWANDFSEGYALVKENDKYGFIDMTGHYVILPSFDFASAFSEERAAVMVDGLWGYIDHTGNMIITPQFNGASDFKEGKAAVDLGSRERGYIDIKGNVIIKNRNEFNGDFSGQYATVETRIGDREVMYFINTEGDTVFKGYSAVENFSEGLAMVMTGDRYEGDNALYGFINTKGEEVIPISYKGAQNFSEGLAAVDDGKQWRYIDRSGKKVEIGEYDLATSFSEGLAAVSNGVKWGYIDHSGKLIIDYQYDDVRPFINGLAQVKKEGRHEYIDILGKSIWRESKNKYTGKVISNDGLGISVIVPEEWEGKYIVESGEGYSRFTHLCNGQEGELFFEVQSFGTVEEWEKEGDYPWKYVGQENGVVYVVRFQSECNYDTETEEGKRELDEYLEMLDEIGGTKGIIEHIQLGD